MEGGIYMFSDGHSVNRAFIIVKEPEKRLMDLPAHGKIGACMYFVVENVEDKVKLVIENEYGERVIL